MGHPVLLVTLSDTGLLQAVVVGEDEPLGLFEETFTFAGELVIVLVLLDAADEEAAAVAGYEKSESRFSLKMMTWTPKPFP
jgi:hypothetical protein